MSELPGGAVTFLFTDIAGSTRLWERYPEAMRLAYGRHDAILREAIAGQRGVIYKVVGDALQAAFPTIPAAVAASLKAQQKLTGEDWTACGLPEPLRVRMAMHVGNVAPDPDGDYRSPLLNRLARMLDVAHGGQILLSQETATLLGNRAPTEATLRDLGERRLKDVQGAAHIYQLLHPELPADFPPLATLDRRPHNLPVHATPLLGRAAEVRTVRQLLERHDGGNRLVTLLGPGGIGKTRLALEVATGSIDAFNHGAFWVDLAAVSEPELVLSAIARVLEVSASGGRTLLENLHAELHEREVLLVLDNLEQVIGAGPLLAQLLAGAAAVRMLATSRERLGIRGEQVVPVEPLATPPGHAIALLDATTAEQFAAVQLFRERAQAVNPGFALSEDTVRPVAEICRRLDGLPLAIELAAARSRLFPPAALLARLEQRLPLLTGGPRDLPERQQTLRNAIAWSHDLLSDAEQALFRRLAVFAGGADFTAIEAVTNPHGDLDVPTQLAALVDKSLVYQRSDGSHEPRCGMFETIREYAWERLSVSGEADLLCRAHADHCLDLAEEAEPELIGPAQGAWLARLEREHDNVRAAMEWSLAHDDVEFSLRLGGALWRFWSERVHLSEGRVWLERALAGDQSAPAAVRARGLYAAAILAEDQGDYDQAVERHEAALALWQEVGDQHGIARALGSLGNIAHDRGDYLLAVERHERALALGRQLHDRRQIAVSLASLGTVASYRGDLDGARRYYEESLSLFRALGDTQGTSRLLENLGVVVAHCGDLTRAIALYEEGLAMARDLENPTGIASGLINLGAALQAAGNHDEAERRNEEALELLRKTGDRRHTAVALYNLAEIARDRGDLTNAVALLVESLRLSAEVGNRAAIAECWVILAVIAEATGRPECAARLLGAAAALRDAIGAPLDEEVAADHARLLTALPDALGEAAFSAAWVAGRALSWQEVLAEAGAAAAAGTIEGAPVG